MQHDHVHHHIPKIVENLPSDTRTGQAILFKTNFIGRGQIKIIDAAGFSDVKASQLLSQHLKKKRNQGFIYCLNDRLRFERKGRSKLFRNEIFYSDIKYIYFFSNTPNVFMLGFNDAETPKLVYETYSVNSMEERNKIAETTQLGITEKPDLVEPQTDLLYDSDDVIISRDRSRDNHHCMCHCPNCHNEGQDEIPERRLSRMSLSRSSANKNYKSKPSWDTGLTPNDYVVVRRPTSPVNYRSQQARTNNNVNSTLMESRNVCISSESIGHKSQYDEGPIYLYVQRKPNQNGGHECVHKSNNSSLNIYR